MAPAWEPASRPASVSLLELALAWRLELVLVWEPALRSVLVSGAVLACWLAWIAKSVSRLVAGWPSHLASELRSLQVWMPATVCWSVSSLMELVSQPGGPWR